MEENGRKWKKTEDKKKSLYNKYELIFSEKCEF